MIMLAHSRFTALRVLAVGRSCLTTRTTIGTVPVLGAVSGPWCDPPRAFSTGRGPNLKAVENWKRPTLEEYGVPKEQWEDVDARNQRKYNLYLIGGVAFFGLTLAVAKVSGMFFFHTTPSFAKETGFSTKYGDDKGPSWNVKKDDAPQPPSPKEVAASSAKTGSPTPPPPSQIPSPKTQLVSGTASAADLPVTSLHKDAVPNMPTHVPYLLVGGGTASFAAFRAIRAKDPTAKVLIIGEENRLPYMRPPLSKELWFSELAPPEFKGDVRFTQWNGRTRSLFFEPGAFYKSYQELPESEKGGISVLTGRKVVRIDPTRQEAHLDNGSVIGYDRCLLATGGRPKMLPVLASNGRIRAKVSVFRNIDDFLRLEELTKHLKSVAVIGGGFLGSELACALGNKAKSTGLEVLQLFPEDGNMGKVLPDYLSSWTTEKVRKEGVNVIPNSSIKNATISSSGKLVLFLESGKEVEVDHAIVAVGIEPNTDLARESRLEVDETHKGFRVNAELEARSNLWAAGDAASFYDVTLGRRRVEHHDHAVVSGRLAGENMAASPQERKPYTHQSMFWSDLGPEIGYEAIGLVDAKLDTVGVFAKSSESDTPKAAVVKSDEAMRSEEEESQPPAAEVTSTATAQPPELKEGEKYGKGVIFYLQEGVVVGVVMWNVFGRMSVARKVIRENRKYEDLSELAKLFNIHGSE